MTPAFEIMYLVTIIKKLILSLNFKTKRKKKRLQLVELEISTIIWNWGVQWMNLYIKQSSVGTQTVDTKPVTADKSIRYNLKQNHLNCSKYDSSSPLQRELVPHNYLIYINICQLISNHTYLCVYAVFLSNPTQYPTNFWSCYNCLFLFLWIFKLVLNLSYETALQHSKTLVLVSISSPPIHTQ